MKTEYYTPRSLAEYLGPSVSTAAVRGWIRSGKVHVIKTPGNRYWILSSEAERIKAEMFGEVTEPTPSPQNKPTNTLSTLLEEIKEKGTTPNTEDTETELFDNELPDLDEETLKILEEIPEN